MMAVESLDRLLEDLRRLLHEPPEEGSAPEAPGADAPRVPPPSEAGG